MQSDFQGAYCLNTTVDACAHWLAEHTRLECPLIYPVGRTNGHYVLHPLRLPPPGYDQPPLVLEMTMSYVPADVRPAGIIRRAKGQPRSASISPDLRPVFQAGSEETTTHPPQEMCAISFKIEPVFPHEPRPIEVTTEFHTYLVLGYFERLIDVLLEFWYAQLGWSGVKKVGVSLARIRALKARMGYASRLKLKATATLQELDRCLHDFHPTPPDRKWAWETAPSIGKTLHTRLKLQSLGTSCRGDQMWVAQALDLSSDPSGGDFGQPFCIITAVPLPDYNTASATVLRLNCWPDWNQGPTPQSYLEYLKALLAAFQERGLIRRLPPWLTPPEPTQTTPFARKPRRKQRGKNIDTAFKVARARLIMQLKNKSQTVACGLAPVSSHTFRKWFDDPQVLDEMERLSQDADFINEIEAI